MLVLSRRWPLGETEGVLKKKRKIVLTGPSSREHHGGGAIFTSRQHYEPPKNSRFNYFLQSQLLIERNLHSQLLLVAREPHCLLRPGLCYKGLLEARFHFLNFSWEITGGLLRDTVSIMEIFNVKSI